MGSPEVKPDLTKIVYPGEVKPDLTKIRYPGKDEPLDYLRAGVESLLPITKTIGSLSSMAFPQDQTLRNLDPYSKNPPASKLINYFSDIAGTAANIFTPAKGVGAQAVKFALPVVFGMAAKKVSEAALQNEEIKKAIQSPVGQATVDYILPGTSIFLSSRALYKDIKNIIPTKNVSEFLEKNPKAAEYMFSDAPGLNNKINESNQTSALKTAGFNSAQGNRLKVGNDLYDAVKKTIGGEKENFRLNYDAVKNYPISKDSIKTLLKKMDAEAKTLGNSREADALKADIQKYKGLLMATKKPLVSHLDQLRKDWYDDVANVKDTFKGSYADSVSGNIGREMNSIIESSVPQPQMSAYNAAKASYKTMAEARDEIDKIANGSAEQIMQKLNNSDKIAGMSRLAPPEIINAALKADSHYKFPNDPTKMMNDYLDKLRRIDAVDKDLADKLFNPAQLPIFNNPKYLFNARFGSYPATVGTEINIENKKAKR